MDPQVPVPLVTIEPAPSRARPVLIIGLVILLIVLGLGGTLTWLRYRSQAGLPSPSDFSTAGREQVLKALEAASPPIPGLTAVERHALLQSLVQP